MKIKKQNRGITLIVLIVTIIVLLILAGISIVSVVGENKIINKAVLTKEENEIKDEKEIVNTAVAKAYSRDENNLTYDNLYKELEYLASGLTTLEDGDENNEFLVTFKKSGRVYKVDSNREITSYADESTQLYQLLHLTITEKLASYNESLGEVQMVYRIDVEKNSDVVYSDVKELKYSTSGEKKLECDVDVYVPNGSVVKVTKVYNGNCENVGDVSKQFTISKKGEIYKQLSFSSKYTGNLTISDATAVTFNRNNDNLEVEYEK